MVSSKAHTGKRGSVRKTKRYMENRQTIGNLNVKRRLDLLEKSRQRQKKSRILCARRAAIDRYVQFGCLPVADGLFHFFLLSVAHMRSDLVHQCSLHVTLTKKMGFFLFRVDTND